MSDPTSPTSPAGHAAADLHTQLFANIVMQQAGMAMILLGVTPHPESGETMFDLDGAEHFISQLEMLEAKTKGNLNSDETTLLKQSLTTVRMAFVDAVERGAPPAAPKPRAQAPASPAAPAVEPGPAAAPTAPVSPEAAAGAAGAAGAPALPSGEDERKKFVKKY